MRQVRPAPPAFLFFGVFTGFDGVFAEVRRRVEARFGPIHPRGESPTYPFPETRTYAPAMGHGLLRRFFVLERLWPQDGLAPVKRAALEMEEEIRRGGAFPVERPVNIDPGIINDCRVLLASTKDYSHRIYRGDGIWEEVTLVYEKGAYRPLPWTYPDFRAPTYHAFFEGFRREVLELTWSGPPRGGPPSSPPPA
ncbi:MAG: DUF4416 family protein [Planctomycetes bacterium]|nr:DUF4416 family protein [Planctomycetota bacterium]